MNSEVLGTAKQSWTSTKGVPNDAWLEVDVFSDRSVVVRIKDGEELLMFSKLPRTFGMALLMTMEFACMAWDARSVRDDSMTFLRALTFVDGYSLSFEAYTDLGNLAVAVRTEDGDEEVFDADRFSLEFRTQLRDLLRAGTDGRPTMQMESAS